jgi:putative membrane protein
MVKSRIALSALLICAGITIIPLITPIADGQRNGPGMMYWYGPGNDINASGFQTGYAPSYGMGPWMMDWYSQNPFMGFWMSLIWLIIVIIIAYLIYKLIKSEKILAPSKTIGKSAGDILAERYAKGDLTREQYMQMKEDLKDIQ